MSLRASIGNFIERIRYKFNNSKLIKGSNYEKSETDLELLYNIQPVGNLKAHDKYILRYLNYSTKNGIVK